MEQYLTYLNHGTVFNLLEPWNFFLTIRDFRKNQLMFKIKTFPILDLKQVLLRRRQLIHDYSQKMSFKQRPKIFYFHIFTLYLGFSEGIKEGTNLSRFILFSIRYSGSVVSLLHLTKKICWKHIMSFFQGKPKIQFRL